MSVSELIYDWNTVEPQLHKPERHIGFDDETLRDGLQSPSVCEPSVEKKIELLHLMDALGVDTVDIGLPGAGGTHATGVELMAREIAEKKLKIRPNCAARTHRNDIIPIVEISQRAGIPIEACTFIGSSAIRFFAEDWTLDKLLKLTEDAVTFAVSEGVPVMYVTEDTTRANPETIRALYTTAIQCGAKAVCGWEIPCNYPVFGRDAFRTATGVHAAAVIKSYRKGDRELADLVYSGVPAAQFGLEQVVEIGPMSGKSNVIYWLEKRGIEANEERVNLIYEYAKQS